MEEPRAEGEQNFETDFPSPERSCTPEVAELPGRVDQPEYPEPEEIGEAEPEDSGSQTAVQTPRADPPAKAATATGSPSAANQASSSRYPQRKRNPPDFLGVGGC